MVPFDEEIAICQGMNDCVWNKYTMSGIESEIGVDEGSPGEKGIVSVSKVQEDIEIHRPGVCRTPTPCPFDLLFGPGRTVWGRESGAALHYFGQGT